MQKVKRSVIPRSHHNISSHPIATYFIRNLCDITGGDDFRVVERTSSFGRQIQSTRHAAGAVPIAKGQRFLPSDSYGPGPLLMGQMSCMGKQRLSTRRSYGSITFGTSTRDGAKRLYTLGNSKAH